jgi:hypothetical protein
MHDSLNSPGTIDGTMTCEEITTLNCRCSRTAVYRYRIVRGKNGEGRKALLATCTIHTPMRKRNPENRIAKTSEERNRRP